MLNLLNHTVMDYCFINEDKWAADTSEALAKQRFTMTPDVGRFHSFCDCCNEAMKQRAWNKVRPNYLISPLKTNQLNQASSVIIHPQ